MYKAYKDRFTCVWKVFSTKDRFACVGKVFSTKDRFACVGKVFGTKDRFACVWKVFSTKDRFACVGKVFSTKDRFACVGKVFSTKDRFACVGKVFSTKDSSEDYCLHLTRQIGPEDLKTGTEEEYQVCPEGRLSVLGEASRLEDAEGNEDSGHSCDSLVIVDLKTGLQQEEEPDFVGRAA
ncbi:hypothetical protein Bbelb_015430 [Branchiostoma belcheri]|nr:hypothetical protein Bbelb_015430 [Branchiostoma belcheri]